MNSRVPRGPSRPCPAGTPPPAHSLTGLPHWPHTPTCRAGCPGAPRPGPRASPRAPLRASGRHAQGAPEAPAKLSRPARTPRAPLSSGQSPSPRGQVRLAARPPAWQRYPGWQGVASTSTPPSSPGMSRQAALILGCRQPAPRKGRPVVCRVSQKAKAPDTVVRTTEAAQWTERREVQHRDGKNGKTER